MLTEKNYQELAKILGTTAEDIKAKIISEKEESLSVPQGDFFSEDELKKRDASTYKDGKEAGEEMQIKGFKKKYGYDIEGKDVDSFFSHHDNELKNKYSKDSTERVKTLESDLEKQKKAYDEEISTYTSKISSLESKYGGELIKNKLLGMMPKETTIKPEAIITLFKSEYELINEDGKTLVKKEGEVLKDTKTATPLEVSSVFNEFVAKEGYSKGKQGRGVGNDFGDNNSFSSKTPQDFQRDWQKKNPDVSTTSKKYDEDYAEWRKNIKDKVA